MPTIDLPTLFFVSTALLGVMAALFAVTWLQNRRQNAAMGYWSLAHGLAMPASVMLALRGHCPDWVSIGLANTMIALSYALAFTGTRVFDGRRPQLAAIVAGPAVWLIANHVPAIYESFPVRVIVMSSIVVAYAVASGLTIRSGASHEPLPSRNLAAVVFGVVALTHLVRMALTVYVPAGESFVTRGGGWTAFIAIQVLMQSVVVGYTLLSLTKERGEFRQRLTADIDSLTGILTRRAFADRAAQRLAQTPQRGALLIFDLDRFKVINDTHGHIAGDRVLTRFVDLVKLRLGTADVFGRHGGEEFVLFLGEADIVAAWRVAESIRRDFADLAIHHDGRPIEATVSVGVAAIPLVEPDLDQLIASADAGLYAAKNAGRDRVETAAALPAGEPAAA